MDSRCIKKEAVILLALCFSIVLSVFFLLLGDWISLKDWLLFSLFDTIINVIIAYPLWKFILKQI
jgi:uncharacterized membrane protein